MASPGRTATTRAPEERVLDVGGVRLHCTVRGEGPTVLLLHGWPQTSRAWRRVTAFLPGYRVITPDLRGFGLSDKPAAGYDAASMAADLHQLLAALAVRPVTVVGHDWGAVFGYVLAAAHPGDVAALGIVEMVLPGLGPLEEAMEPRPDGRFLWHLPFHFVPDVPEMLIAGHERDYLRWFFEHHACDPSAVPSVDIDAYVSALSDDGALRASLGVYRAYFETASQVATLAGSRLSIPVVAYGGDASLGEVVLASARLAVPAAEGGVLGRCGHWALDEQPERVAEIVRDLVSAQL